MSGYQTHLAWQHSTASGDALLVLLAMAECADAKGKVHASLQEIRDMTRLDSESLKDQLERLAWSQHITYANGNFRITLGPDDHPPSEIGTLSERDFVKESLGIAADPEAPEPEPEPVEDVVDLVEEIADRTRSYGTEYPKTLVGLVLMAAKVAPDAAQPLYWFQQEHIHDAELLLDRYGNDLDAMLNAVSAAPQHEQVIKRISQIRTA